MVNVVSFKSTINFCTLLFIIKWTLWSAKALLLQWIMVSQFLKFPEAFLFKTRICEVSSLWFEIISLILHSRANNFFDVAFLHLASFWKRGSETFRQLSGLRGWSWGFNVPSPRTAFSQAFSVNSLRSQHDLLLLTILATLQKLSRL